VGVSGCQQPAGSPAAGPSSAPRAGNGAVDTVLPNLVGRGLQYAQDTAQDAGYYLLTSHDALGRGRHQILDRDWKVCFQDPPEGKVPNSTTIDFGVVKLDENCPAADQTGAAPAPAGASMPDLVGKSAAVAESSLGSNASISFEDASGADRTLLVASNWQVCAQDPAPGKPYDGVPVTLTVVKFAEHC
jgi:hypothetical protein